MYRQAHTEKQGKYADELHSGEELDAVAGQCICRRQALESPILGFHEGKRVVLDIDHEDAEDGRATEDVQGDDALMSANRR